MSAHHAKTLSLESVRIPEGHALQGLPRTLGIVGGVGLVASAGLAVASPDTFYASYLTSFMYWLSIGLGALWVVLVHHAVRAGWSVVIRRLAENLMSTLPVFALLFVPIILGMENLFHWMHPEGDPVLEGKASFLNPTFFLVRVGIYFTLWTVLANFYYRRSVASDGAAEDTTPKMRFWAPLGILAYAMTSSFAAIDWMMSLDPHWFSTMFGVYYFGGTVVAIYAMLIVICVSLQKRGFLEDVVTAEHYHDMGKMMFAFVVFWAYIAFSQYMLIWYANIPEETAWFQMRMEGSWFYFSMFLCVGHFGLPFFYLMGRTLKRIKKTIFIGAIWMLFMHYVDMFFIIQPTLSHHHGGHGFAFHLTDLTTFVGIGGVVLAVFAKRLVAQPMVPTGDPRLQESLAFENF